MLSKLLEYFEQNMGEKNYIKCIKCSTVTARNRMYFMIVSVHIFIWLYFFFRHTENKNSEQFSGSSVQDSVFAGKFWKTELQPTYAIIMAVGVAPWEQRDFESNWSVLHQEIRKTRQSNILIQLTSCYCSHAVVVMYKVALLIMNEDCI